MLMLHLGLTSCLAVMVTAFALSAADSSEQPKAATPAANQSYQIRNKKFGEPLRPEDANSTDGTRIVLYPAQAWKCLTWKMHPAGEAVFQLQNHYTSKTFAAAAEADGEQVAVRQVPFSGEPQERPTWRFTKLPDGLYQITELKSGRALTAVRGDGGGVRVVAGPWQKSDEQKWELVKVDPAKLTM